MGRGIAQVAALGGFETRLYDAFPAAAEEAATKLREALAKGAARGRWSEAEADAAAGRIGPALAIGELAGCELLIEAAPEDVELKRRVFGDAGAARGAAAILASNTSSLRVTDIAAGVPEPERVVGMHFFNPPVLMKLVEVVAAERSSARALAATAEGGAAVGSTPIRARDSPGFVANRLARPFALESLRMLGDGVADAATIDRVVRLGGGFRMGPFELIDLIGLDVNLTIARSFFAQGGEPERWRPNPIQERLVEEGRLGRKSGQGYYPYGDGSKRAPDPQLAPAAPTPAAPPPAAGAGRPRRQRGPPPPLRPDRQRDRLRAGGADRLPGGHGHGDAPRPQLAGRSARDRRDGRRQPRRRAAGRAGGGARRCLRPGAAATPRGRTGSRAAPTDRGRQFRDELTVSTLECGYSACSSNIN